MQSEAGRWGRAPWALQLLTVCAVGLITGTLVALGPFGDNLAAGPAKAMSSAAPVAAANPSGRTLSFEDRVRYQRRIEEVYWKHRIWPADNPNPKPPLDQVLSHAAIRDRVASYLEKSAALEIFWSRTLTGEQLQVEVNRIARDTKRPDVLRELFATLGDDPFLVAECLARPLLVDRLTRNWYARDTRFHGALKQQAAAALATHPDNAAWMPALGGEYGEAEWLLETGELRAAERNQAAEHSVIELTVEQWQEKIGRLAATFGVEREPEAFDDPAVILKKIPVGRLSPLKEENDRFVVTALLWTEPHGVRVATVSWSKQPFDTWWAEYARTVVASRATLDPAAVAPPTGGYSPLSVAGTGCTVDSWTPTADWGLPAARWGHTAVWTGTEMIVWGGGNTGGRYDPVSDSWKPTSTGEGVPTGRGLHTAVWTGTEMIVWGSSGDSTGGRYDPVSDSWTPTSTGLGVPSPRSGHTAVWTGTEMIVWGGDGDTGTERTGGRYDPASDSWTPTWAGLGVPSARAGHTAAWTGTEMIVWGGTGGAYPPNLENTGGRYDPVSDSWTPTSTGANVPTVREGPTAVWTGTEMIVWGGDGDTGTENTGGRYDPASDSWTPTSTGANVPAARSLHTAVWTGTEMIVWGGGTFDSTGGRYAPADDSWTPTSTGANVPGARWVHTAVWTGAEMIVWGGLRIGGSENTGGRYDPADDSWTPTSSGVYIPTARFGHTAVWTGAEMIFWGGVGRDTGGRYDPASDSWAPTSIGAGVPTGREGHTAVWTGTEMIVWGGLDYPDLYNTGGRYNPASDSWMPTSIGAGVPTGRGFHTAVWTGAEMIVWGTSSDSTGGRYDPVGDSWTPTSTGSGVPTPRYENTAVWTGTEMIVWGGGGEGTGTPRNTGGRYDPASDSWTPTSTVGAPSPRLSHTAVWTGAEMIVWGGSPNPGPPYWTGGRYDPSGNSWIPTAHPSLQKEYHTAVWTGTEMIVWGGTGSDGYENYGGRYDPASNSWAYTSTGGDVPSERSGHTAVWTGSEMIVWGGQSDDGVENTGGRYCACEGGMVSHWYPDADGDGYGASSAGVPYCVQLPGYVAVAGDCDDANPLVNPDGTETCNAIDDDCNALIDEDLLGEDTDADGVHNLCDNCLADINPDQNDADGDQVGNVCDNCPSVWNAGQLDFDLDDHGDSCDNCPQDHNPTQDDRESDGVGDLCDNCIDAHNPTQADVNGDSTGDHCDLSDDLIYVTFEPSNQVRWQEETGYQTWNVYSGDMDALASTGEYTQLPGSNAMAGRECALGEAQWAGVGTPNPGHTAFVLATGNSALGESGLGTDSEGQARPNTNACP